MERRHQPVEAFFQPEMNVEGEVLPSDIRTVIVGEDEYREWTSGLEQDQDQDQDQDPLLPRIKEEEEEFLTSQEEEQLQGLEETDVPKSTFSPVPVKTEDDDDEELQSSQSHQGHIETRNSGAALGPDRSLEPGPDVQDSDSSDTEISDGDWEDPGELDSGLKSLNNNQVPDFPHSAIERSFSCSECGQRFGRKPHLNAHMRIHTGEKPFSCSFCGKRFSQKGNSISHMRLHTGEKPFSCSVCEKRFRYSGDVSRHMRIHMGKNKTKHTNHSLDSGPEPPRNLNPDQYLALLTDDRNTESEAEPSEPHSEIKAERRDDVRGNSGDKESFSCSECGRMFCRKDHLMSHMRTHTGEKPFSCSICHKRFSCSGNILAHMRIHTGEKPFECSFCGKSFSQKGTLQLHIRIHTGEKPFSCPFCGKRFAHKRRMTLHMSVHTEEKRFSCTACDKRFTWYTQLKTHKCVGESSQLRQSQTEKRVPAKESFSCSECGKQFSLKGNLKTHMRIHTGEKPFSCFICGKSFKQNVHLTEHMTIHTGQKLYQCNICGKGFNKKLLIKKHACV